MNEGKIRNLVEVSSPIDSEHAHGLAHRRLCTCDAAYVRRGLQQLANELNEVVLPGPTSVR